MAHESTARPGLPLRSSVGSIESQPRRSALSLARIQRRLHTFRSSSDPDVTVHENLKGRSGLNLLHDPAEPRIDLVFVHGLGGSSMKTWCGSSDPASFWPKEWLPSEPGFKNVRIHSYGYNANWSQKHQSLLGIHDFGQAFLADMFNSPHLRKNGDTPIVIVAHSMGGLVAKKAYLLATRDPSYREFAARLHSMFFLATPHRGADSSQFLSKYIAATMLQGEKPYVNELHPGSSMLQTINDEFRHIAHDLKLWSFFEGLPTRFGVTSTIVVEKESAIIGLPGERTRYLDADHRHICKFDDPEDPNYVTIQRCLSTTMEDIEKDNLFRRHDELKSEMKRISTFLAVAERPESDLLTATEKQLPGTCTWLTENPLFSAWLEKHLDDGDASSQVVARPETHVPRFLWLNGAPGSGKSVACGHVVQHLESSNLDCSFYFLRHDNKEKSTVDGVLRSIAFQMAESNFDIRKALLTMADNEEKVNPNDHKMIWNNVFSSRIFKTKFATPQFWVIDALDECGNKGSTTLLQLLSKIPADIPLQIFLSSRPSGQIQQALSREESSLYELQTGHKESLDDIARFIKSRSPSGHDYDFSELLISDILSKSNGIFLWASLVMNRLEEAYSEEDMQDVLEQLPTEMNDFYSRIARSIAESPSFELAKCILKWTVCASRPLTTDEIREAVKYDVDRTLTASDDRIGQLCGNLVSIDKKNRVHVIHQTVTAFLTIDKSQFWVDQPVAHARMAEICLTHLTRKEFMPPRSRRPSASATQKMDSPLTAYADTYFAFHLARCSSAVDAPLILLDNFLRSNVLTWIERTAKSRRLETFLETVQHLISYLKRRQKYRSPLGKEVQLTEKWINDLARVVAAFGPNLLDSPSSIYSIVPTVSPPASNIHRLFAKENRQLRLLGRAPEEDWDDRISCLIQDSETTSLATCDEYFAVGLSSGKIMVYNSLSLKLVATLTHGERIRLLTFGSTTPNLVACGARKMTFWNSQRTCVWTKSARRPLTPLRICFSKEDDQILVASEGGSIVLLSVEDGSQLDTFPLYRNSDSESDEEDRNYLPGTPPKHIRMSAVHGLAAVTYRMSPVLLWDLEERRKIGVFYRPGTEDVYSQPQVHDMIFNPLPELDLLAIAYDQVGIVTCDPWSLEQHSVCEVDARTMAASPDGRTLVAGDYSGIMYIFAFENELKVLYRISTLETIIRGVGFASNSLRFYDLRGRFCNVWEPPVLTRRDSLDDSSTDPPSEEFGLVADMVIARPLNNKEYITCLASSADGDSIFCGRDNGVVSVYNVASGIRQQDFSFYQSEYAIKHLEWSAKNKVLVCVNAVNRCIANRLAPDHAPDRAGPWKVSNQILDHQANSPVTQVLLEQTGTAFLIAAAKCDEVWNVDGELAGSIEQSETEERRTWLAHPNHPELLLEFHENTMCIFEWKSFKRVATNEGIPIRMKDSSFSSLQGDWMYRKGYDFLIKAGPRPLANNRRTTGFAIIDVSNLKLDAADVTATCLSKELVADMERVLGLYKSSLLFLDSKGWICSALKGVQDTKTYIRHFFIPLTWMVGGDLLLQPISKSSIALAHRDQLIVFHGFLDFEEKVPFAKAGEI